MDELETLKLPLAAVTRIARRVMPVRLTMSPEFRQSLSHAATLFILYASTNASKIAKDQNRKTLLLRDVMQFFNDRGYMATLPPESSVRLKPPAIDTNAHCVAKPNSSTAEGESAAYF
ncbi:hypothetical protein M514_05426 [Trichuris suis]|uniref:DNA polymerase epsilon subunit 3 n=1 Tax=Trichuris suis TaxID=68888 RepID=A0A085M925_9BILA|nr:hypothetical protein M513_05426 [Trichuris suis]KFD72436.1 hypothetical protein M514_05426 [Trichuris suis]KHJ48842.1 hypothetical protein D918_01147 [Trichuris suis]